MENVNLLDIMKQSIEERKPQNKPEKVLKGFLIINFNSNKYINDFYKSIDGIISKEIKILDNSIICEFPNKKELREANNLLDGILFTFKSNLLNIEFEPNWLDFFNKNKNFDIKNTKEIETNKLTKQDIEESLKNKEDKEENLYSKTKKEFLVNSNNYDLNNFSKDWEIYLSNNFETTGNKNELKNFLEESTKNLKKALENKIICDFESFYQLETSIKEKSERIIEKNCKDDREKINKYKENQKKLKEGYEKSFTNKTNIRKIWEENSKLFVEEQKKYKIKFELKNDYIPFNGVQNNYKEDHEDNIDYRLSNKILKYMTKEQGFDLNYLILSSIVSNYLSIVTQKQKSLLRKNLIDISKTLDKKSYFDSLEDIIKNVKNYENNKEIINENTLNI